VSIPKLVPRDPGGPSWPYTFHGGLQGICQVFQLFLGQGPEHHDLPQGTHLQGTGRSAMDPRSPRNKASISQPKIMYHHLSSSIIIYHHLSPIRPILPISSLIESSMPAGFLQYMKVHGKTMKRVSAYVSLEYLTSRENCQCFFPGNLGVPCQLRLIVGNHGKSHGR
jgi:hypothetical protein